jgi:hypothetical protein
MASLVYAPEVRILIATSPESRGKGKIVEVTEDISNGSLTRISNGISKTNFVLLNQGRKYDGLFTPMDRVVVYLRRIKTVLKFSGYLDYSPTFQAEPGSLSLTASCTMKRVANFMWDPGSPQASILLNTLDTNDTSMQDGGTARRAIDVLTNVVGWPKGSIHIGRVPSDWYETVSKVADRLIADAEVLSMSAASGSGATINGENPTLAGTATVAGIGSGTGVLPAQVGRCSSFGGPNGGAYGNFALTGEPGTKPNDGWYCAMRWGYVTDAGSTIPGYDVGAAKKWWANRKILVTNPGTGKSVVVRAADWGPNVRTGRVIDLAPTALTALGGRTDDTMHIAFAPAGASLGPVTASSNSGLGGILSASGNGSTNGAAPVTTGWGRAGDKANMVQVEAGGIKFTCHRLAQHNFVGFINDLISSLGYHPKVIQGFVLKDIAGTTTPSNHSYGAAIDIDPTINKRYPTSAGGKYALPHPPAIVNLARKWGLGWGGEYQNSKDYMHFEVLGAPASTAKAYTVPAGTTGSVLISKWQPPIHNPPGYTITARFADGGTLWAKGTHSGTDFACAAGTPIYPVGPGTIHDHGTGDPDYGNWVSVDHGNKIYTQYAHMQAPSPLPVGAAITSNTIIGKVGSTGNATGPHVHVELRKGADTYTAATKSGGIEKYVLGGADRLAPPDGALLIDGGDYSTTDAGGTSLDDIGNRLFSVWSWEHQYLPTVAGQLLSGYRALMNDSPALQTVGEFMGASMREYCSAPNGDFIAWFPDHFGHYKQAGKMVVSPLEVGLESGPPTIGWTDNGLITHQFVTGSTAFGSNDADSIVRQQTTAGIASVEFPELMQALLNISKKEAIDLADKTLRRYGARPDYTPMNMISGHRAEFFMACDLFQRGWSQQYQTAINLTFMPELYPGMLLCIPAYGIQGYITQTVDSWDLRGGGFSTTVSAAPWSSIGRNSHPAAAGLPVGAPL